MLIAGVASLVNVDVVTQKYIVVAFAIAALVVVAATVVAMYVAAAIVVCIVDKAVVEMVVVAVVAVAVSYSYCQLAEIVVRISDSAQMLVPQSAPRLVRLIAVVDHDHNFRSLTCLLVFIYCSL